MDSGRLGTALVLFALRIRTRLGFLPLLIFVDHRYPSVRLTGKAFRVIPPKKFHVAFANFAAQVEKLPGIGAADQDAELDRSLLHIGHLQSAHFAVPLWIVIEESLQFLAQLTNWGVIIKAEINGANQLSGNATPVLERLFYKIGDGQNHPAQVPGPDSHIGESDFLDLAELTFDDHNVIDEERLCESDLNPSKYVAQDPLRSESNHDAGNSC